MPIGEALDHFPEVPTLEMEVLNQIVKVENSSVTVISERSGTERLIPFDHIRVPPTSQKRICLALQVFVTAFWQTKEPGHTASTSPTFCHTCNAQTLQNVRMAQVPINDETNDEYAWVVKMRDCSRCKKIGILEVEKKLTLSR